MVEKKGFKYRGFFSVCCLAKLDSFQLCDLLLDTSKEYLL